MGERKDAGENKSSKTDKLIEQEKKKADSKKADADINARTAKGRSTIPAGSDKVRKQEKVKKDFEELKKDTQRMAEQQGSKSYDDLAGKVPHPEKHINKSIPQGDLPTIGKRQGYGKMPDKFDFGRISKEDTGLQDDTKKIADQSEKHERARIAHPEKGVGFGFGKRTASDKEMERLYNSLSPEEKAALPKKDTRIDLRGYASRPGDEKYNKQLSEERAQSVKDWLVKNKGANPDSFHIKAFGEESGKRMQKSDKKDDSTDRVVLINIIPEGRVVTDKPDDKPDGSDDAKKEAGKIVDGIKLPEPPKDYKTKDGIKDTVIDIAFNTALEILELQIIGVVKTLVDNTLKLAEAIGECHDNNVKQAKVNGFTNGISVLWHDKQYTNNPHINDGKPFTKDDFCNRAKKVSSNRGYMDEAFGKVEATKDVAAAYRESTDKLVDVVNGLLKEGKTPAQRKAILDKFVNHATKKFQQVMRESKK